MLHLLQPIVFVPTTDVERARAFYCDALGLRQVRDDGHALVLACGNVMLRIVRTEGFEPRPFTVAGWEVTDIEATMRALGERGVGPLRYSHFSQDELGIWQAPGGDRVAWFRDPDENVLSVSQHRELDELDVAVGEQVLSFWFGRLDAEGFSEAAQAARWWKKDPLFDRTIRRGFASLHAEAASGSLEAWAETARGTLALIVLLDQMSRNLYRGSPSMFACDALALHHACRIVDDGMDQQLRGDMRVFSYMPFMHSESHSMQQRSVALFEKLMQDASPQCAPRLRQNLEFAKAHRDIVARFGRFPHRNVILGRQSSDEEVKFLSEPGSSF